MNKSSHRASIESFQDHFRCEDVRLILVGTGVAHAFAYNICSLAWNARMGAIFASLDSPLRICIARQLAVMRRGHCCGTTTATCCGKGYAQLSSTMDCATLIHWKQPHTLVSRLR
ncbi:transmembrane protein, putative [Bodo saltans]|uniref:Transmembrane protein, putative n=1 Tax=Bodo saltans TaxID=75058 RepID=A0A0S4JD01_BODSA|nr:transmembrane protein, putative [Bodo saltans]|eukprot:CUG89270.1 transmembrane protein, putative [Bodo saltans]